MKVTVISTGSAKGNAYLVEDGHTTILLDAGAQVEDIKKAVNFAVGRISACLVTHEHGDHAKSVGKLLFYGIDVYMSAGTALMCGFSENVHVETVEALKPFRVGTFRVVPFDVEHDAAEPLGYLVDSEVTGERLLYFTDTAFVRYLFPGVTHIIGECNHSQELIERNAAAGTLSPELAARVVKNHMSLERFLDYVEKMDRAKLRQIFLIHASDSNANDALFLTKVREATGVEVEMA